MDVPVDALGIARDAAGLARARRGLEVALVRPPVVVAPRSLSYYGAVPDLGLAYVAAAVRRAGHRVTLIDAPGEALDEIRPWPTAVGELHRQGLNFDAIVRRIPKATRVVGLTHMFVHEWELLRQLMTQIRRAHPQALIVAGGENATAFWSTMLRESSALDACVLGEGEATFCELLARVERELPWRDTPAVAYRGDGGPVANPREASRPGRVRGRIADLDALPRPAWDLFPIEHYFERGLGSGVDRGRALPVLTSRGCPFQCTFCSAPQMWTTRYVRRDPELVLDEIESYVDRYKIDNVNVNDLTSLLTKEWILEFCAGVRRRGLKITWQLPSGTRSEAVDEEAARAMATAGCTNFCYAPESGSPSELRRIKKRVDPDRLRASLRGSVAAGLQTQASIIIGMPEQTLRELWDSYRFMLRMADDGLHAASVLVFAPYPGSAEHNKLHDAGRIQYDQAYLYGSLLRSVGSSRSHHPRLSSRALLVLQYGMMVGFFARQYARRPSRAARVVTNLIRGRQETALELMLTSKARQWRRAAARWRMRQVPDRGTTMGSEDRTFAHMITRIVPSS